MLRSAVLILSGNAAASLLLLVRNLIVARLIPVADYGIAATFAIAMAVVEMMSALGLQQQIVQAKNGEDPQLQAALQGFQLLRGVIAGLALLVLAGPIAGFMGVPEVAWAYRVMAAVPVLNALVHFDIYRLNRQMLFWPMLLTGAVPALASVIALWPLAQWYGDYRVMLYAIVVQAVLTALTSHLVARRRWHLVLDRAIMAGSLRFGWPLLVNGVLLFAVFNGDKLLVGRALGMEALAVFAMGFTLTLTPTLVMAKSAQSFFLPQLSGVNRDTAEGAARFAHLAMVTVQGGFANGAVLVLAVALLGQPVVDLLLGIKYGALVPLLVPLAAVMALRVFKTGPAVVALARGQTGNAMISNLPRVASLPLVWVALGQGAGLLSVIWIALAGEAIGLALSLWLVALRGGLPLRPLWLPLAATALFLGAAVLPAAFPAAVLPGWGGPALLLVLFAALVATLRDMQRYLRRRSRPKSE